MARGGSGFRDRMLTVKSRKTPENQPPHICISSSYANIFASGVSLKWVKSRRRREKKKGRKLVITMASYALQRHLGWRTQSRLANKLGLICAELRTSYVELWLYGQINFDPAYFFLFCLQITFSRHFFLLTIFLQKFPKTICWPKFVSDKWPPILFAKKT